jgi:hypothetical protein
VETLTLVVLITNRLTVHAEPVTSVVGPLHGFAYLAVIATGLLAPLPRRSRLLTLVPAIGGLLALRGAGGADADVPPEDADVRPEDAAGARTEGGRG